MSEKVSGGAEPQPLAQLPGQNPGREQETLAGVGEFCRGEGQNSWPSPMGMALCSQKSKLLASTQALATQVGPRRQCLAAFKANQFHDETQVRNKTTAENTFM